MNPQKTLLAGLFFAVMAPSACRKPQPPLAPLDAGSPTGLVAGQVPCRPIESAAMRDATRVPVADSPVRGASNALVTIVEFSDFQCPFCRRAEGTLQQLRADFGGDLRVVYKHNPLGYHTHAMPAAEAAQEALAQQGNDGFWRYHDALFAHQEALERADLERYASLQGLDMARFRAALDGHVHQARIQRDARLAEGLQAESTPTFFINGAMLVGAQSYEVFHTLVERARARARTIVPRASAYAQMVEEAPGEEYGP